MLKFIYSEKATKFCEIFTLLLTTVHTVKSKVKILQNFVVFSKYMNFNTKNYKKTPQTIRGQQVNRSITTYMPKSLP